MTPAKPQQMSGQNDPDDLIAELTKLMATDASGRGAEPPKPAAAAPAQAAAAARPAAPQTIRIPGMSQPVAATGTPTGTKFDFGRAPQTSSMPAPEPLANWQDRLGSKPTPANSTIPAFGAPTGNRQEPSLGTGNWRPAIAPGEAERAASGTGGGFEFDFGFNRQRPEPPKTAAAPTPAATPAAPRQVAAAPAPQPIAPVAVAAAPAPRPARDPIAELIAAELDAAVPGRQIAVAVTAPVPVEVEPVLEPEPEPPHELPVAARSVNFAPFSAPPRPAPQPALALPEPVPQRPAAQAPRPQENDRFATAPVFGLGNRPAGEPVTPKVDLDPMDEIENLIGEAVRVELNAPPPPPAARSYDEPPAARQQPQQQQQPVVPPLNTNFAPRRSSLREPEPAPGGADEAILAAAAATGAEVGRVGSPFADERPVKPKKQARRERPAREERQSGGAFRTLVVPAIAGTILLALGFGLYWALGMGSHDGKAPVLTADATPAKTVPTKAVDSKPHSVVMDELSGSPAAPAKETLVSRDQTAGSDATQVATPATAAAASDGGLANRKVRTVTVRPDGTIVSSDDSVAGAAQLPVDRPNVPAVPGVAAANAAETASAPAATTDASTDDTAPATADAAPASAAAPSTQIASVDSSAGRPDANAPMPMSRSLRPQFTASAGATVPAQATTTSVRPTSPVNAVVRNGSGTSQKPMDLIGDLAASSEEPVISSPRPAARAPQQPTQQLASSDASDAPAPVNAVAHVQLSSQQSAAGAQASANTLQKRFGSLFNGVKPQVVKVDLGAKGIYYRVVVPAGSLGDAQQLCASIKSNGGECVAGNG